MLQLPAAKTPVLEEMRIHVIELFKILDRILTMNKLRVRDQIFSQYSRRLRVLHRICDRITSNNDNMNTCDKVVAFGGGMFNSSSKDQYVLPALQYRLECLVGPT